MLIIIVLIKVVWMAMIAVCNGRLMIMVNLLNIMHVNYTIMDILFLNVLYLDAFLAHFVALIQYA
jgi:hypothetical protein